MNGPRDPAGDVFSAVAAALGPPPWADDAVRAHVAPLFSRHRAAYRDRVYLANHSLGRPLDATAHDLREGLDAWIAGLGDAWDAWEAENRAYRARAAAILGAARGDTIVPKTSAGAGLRAVLSTFDAPPRVVSTHGEFDSLDLILREWARRGRLSLMQVAPRAPVAGTRDHRALEHYDTDDLVAAIVPGTDLVVVSDVMFQTGQRVDRLDEVVARARGRREGARRRLPLGGRRAARRRRERRGFRGRWRLQVPARRTGRVLSLRRAALARRGLRTLDTGWFAKDRLFDYRRPDPPDFARGGDGWLESTPPVLTMYQARAGQRFALALRAAALREDSLARQRDLVARLDAAGIAAVGGTTARGAFVVVPFAGDGRAARVAGDLARRGIDTDARGACLRLCPDLLTSTDDLARAVEELASIVRSGRIAGTP